MADDEEEKKKSGDDGGGDSDGGNKSSSGKDQGQPKDSGPNNDSQDQGGQDQGGPQFSPEAQEGRREEGGGGKSSSGKDRDQPKDSGPNNEPQDQGGPQFSPEAQQGGQDGGDPYGYESSSNDPGGFYQNPPPGVSNDPYNYESSSNNPSSFYRDPGSQYGDYQGPRQDTGDNQRLEQELQQAYQFARQQAPLENLAPESNVQQYPFRSYDAIRDMIQRGTQNFGYQPGYDPATGQTTEITRPETLSTAGAAPLQNGPLTTQAGVPGGPLQNGPLVATPAPTPSTAVPAPAAAGAAVAAGVPAGGPGSPLSPEATATAPATATAVAPTTPAQVAGGVPAYTGPTDQQTLAGQSPGSQGAFKDVYGQNADKAWQIEHGEELKNIALYGAAKPPPNAPAAPGAPAGIPPYRGPDPAVAKMLDTFRVAPPVAAAGPGAPARPGAPVVPTPQTGVAVASAAAPGAAPVASGSPVLPTPGTPGAPAAGGVVGMAQAADGREVPIVESVIGRVVNQQPLDAVAIASGMTKADGTAIEGARNQAASEIARETEIGDSLLTPIAQIAWYKENLVRDASFRLAPERAPVAYINSWKGMWKAGEIAPMTTALAAGLIKTGEKPPWETRAARTVATSNDEINRVIRGQPPATAARSTGPTNPAAAGTGMPAGSGFATQPAAASIGPTNPAAAGVGQGAGDSGFAGQGITATTNPATSGTGMPAGSGFAGQGQAINRGPDTRPLTADEENGIYAARPPIPQAPAASTGPVAATVPAASAAPGGLITQAAPTPVLNPERPRSEALAEARATGTAGGVGAGFSGNVGGAQRLEPDTPITLNRGRTGEVEAPPSPDRAAGILGTGIDATVRSTAAIANRELGRLGTGIDATRYGIGPVNESLGTTTPPVDPADISSVQGTPSSADRYQTGEEVIPPYIGPQRPSAEITGPDPLRFPDQGGVQLGTTASTDYPPAPQFGPGVELGPQQGTIDPRLPVPRLTRDSAILAVANGEAVNPLDWSNEVADGAAGVIVSALPPELQNASVTLPAVGTVTTRDAVALLVNPALAPGIGAVDIASQGVFQALAPFLKGTARGLAELLGQGFDPIPELSSRLVAATGETAESLVKKVFGEPPPETVQVFHGSAEDFKNFDPAILGRLPNWYEGLAYTTTNPDVALGYGVWKAISEKGGNLLEEMSDNPVMNLLFAGRGSAEDIAAAARGPGGAEALAQINDALRATMGANIRPIYIPKSANFFSLERIVPTEEANRLLDRAYEEAGLANRGQVPPFTAPVKGEFVWKKMETIGGDLGDVANNVLSREGYVGIRYAGPGSTRPTYDSVGVPREHEVFGVFLDKLGKVTEGAPPLGRPGIADAPGVPGAIAAVGTGAAAGAGVAAAGNIAGGLQRTPAPGEQVAAAASQYDPIRIRTSDTAGLAQRMLDQMDASIASQALPAQAGPSVAPSVAGRTPTGAEDTAASPGPGTATGRVPWVDNGLISAAERTQPTVLGIATAVFNAKQQGATDIQAVTPEFSQTLAKAISTGETWANAALEPVARLAWSRDTGLSADQAPQDYVDLWTKTFKEGGAAPMTNELANDLRSMGVQTPSDLARQSEWQRFMKRMEQNDPASYSNPEAMARWAAYACAGASVATAVNAVKPDSAIPIDNVMAKLDRAGLVNPVKGLLLGSDMAPLVPIFAQYGVEAKAENFTPARLQQYFAEGGGPVVFSGPGWSAPGGPNPAANYPHIYVASGADKDGVNITESSGGKLARLSWAQWQVATGKAANGAGIYPILPGGKRTMAMSDSEAQPVAAWTSINPDTMEQASAPMGGSGGTGRTATNMNALMGSKFGTNVQQQTTDPADRNDNVEYVPSESAKNAILGGGETTPESAKIAAAPIPEYLAGTAPREGLISGVDEPADQAARTWQSAFQISGGDKAFADAVLGVITQEGGFNAGGDTKGGPTKVVGLYQFTNPRGAVGMKDFYNRWLQDNYPDLASPTNAKREMSVGDQEALNKAAMNIDLVNKYYLPKFYEGWKNLKKEEPGMSATTASGLLATQGWWMENEGMGGAGYKKYHNNGAPVGEYNGGYQRFINGQYKKK